MAHTATTRAEAFEPMHEEPEKIARLAWGIQIEDETQKPLSWRVFRLATHWFGHEEHNDVEAFLAWLPTTIGRQSMIPTPSGMLLRLISRR